MIPFLIIFASLILEVSIGGFFGITRGTFHIYASAFIITAFLIKKENLIRLSLAAGLAADIFLSSLNFFGFFLVLYIVLGYFIAWLRTIFLKTGDRAVILFRFIPAIVLYWILYTGFGEIKNYFLNIAPAASRFGNVNFFIGEMFGILASIITFMAVWAILKNKNI